MKLLNPVFIFDVESVGLHGEAFAVAGGLYCPEGALLRQFAFHCGANIAKGFDGDRKWVNDNVTIHSCSIFVDTLRTLRDLFWNEWMRAKAEGAHMFVECGWPVEANFIEACVEDDPQYRNWEGPYPMHEIASVMLAAGMDPMAAYERQVGELPAHEPLADSRLSARLLFQALSKLP